jgi:Cu(I)/Ag(I) efflux system protein CusF
MRKVLLSMVFCMTATSVAWGQPMTSAEVRKVDKAQSRITLRHGEIKSLDMPPMTMVFRVKDPRLIEKLAVGDKVLFNAEKIDGNYVVTLIEVTP